MVHHRDAPPLPSLTPKETMVLELYSTGMHYTDVADELGCSRETIKAHLRAARRKLGARTTTQAVAMSIREGVI